jgi:hypothetical protein
MKINRKFKIERRVITIEDIQRLVNILEKEYLKLEPNSNHIRLLFRGSTEDGIIFESETPSDFLSAELMQTKRTLSFDCSLIDFTNDLSIYISLLHGNSTYSNNSVSVQGKDSNWVNALDTRLKESFEAALPQNSFLLKNKTFIEILFAFGISRFYYYFLHLIVFPFIPVPDSFSKNPPTWIAPLATFIKNHHLFATVIDYLVCFPVGWLASIYLISKAKNLWPSIEFQVGPTHKFIEVKRRNLIYAFYSLGILPLVLSILYDIVKSFTN